MGIKKSLKKKYLSLRMFIYKISKIKDAKKMAFAESYFPEKELKPLKLQKKENVKWLFKYGEVNKFYKLYGQDVVGSSMDFQDYLSFMISRNAANKIGTPESQTVLLRDKFVFYKYMKSFNLPVAEVFAVCKDSVLYDTNLNPITDDVLIKKENFFIKELNGECASFVKKVKNIEDYHNLKDKPTSYILQDSLVQSDAMNKINSGALNTLRIVTINKDNNPYVLFAILRVGTEKTGNVDNCAAGGLAIAVNENGYLKEFGFYKPGFGTKTNVHPDTGIVFSEFEVPNFEKACKLVCEAHKCFYGIRSIGWDIALTENGPVFIEGNDNWEISGIQGASGSLKEDWKKAVSDYDFGGRKR